MRNLLFFSFVVIVISCGQERRKVIAGDLEASSPPFWYYFTIQGLDSDKDGVRDDVEIWINNYTIDYHLNRSLKQFASATELILKVSDRPQAILAMKESRRSNECFFFIGHALHPLEFAKNPLVLNLIHNLILNNPWRKHQYNKMKKFIPSSWDSYYSSGPYERFASCNYSKPDFDILLEKYEKKFPKDYRLKELINQFKSQVIKK